MGPRLSSAATGSAGRSARGRSRPSAPRCARSRGGRGRRRPSASARRRLLSHVAAQGCETVCVRSLTDDLRISRPTVSDHLKRLVDAGLVTREQRGKWAHCSVVPEAFAELRALLDLR
ncbi:helix-turn-helix domain-containing protein [Kocuria sp. CPCC 205268]|uniref:ArsR/SmtB family transcription factor n=1 Tax=Kocuria oxytropis TaxID=3058913 RepID=UPI0034D45B78